MSMSEARCVMGRMNGDSVRINSCFCSLDVATFTVSLLSFHIACLMNGSNINSLQKLLNISAHIR